MSNSAVSDQTKRASLAPAPELAPPGGCRGLLTGWPQLGSALGRLEQYPAPYSKLQLHAEQQRVARFGSAAALMAQLAAHPLLLGGARPPRDIYAQVAWLATQAAAAAQTFRATLTQLPVLLSAQATSPQREAGALTTQVLVGPRGLKHTADSLASVAEQLAQQLAAIDLGPEGALEHFRAATAALERQVHATGSVEPPDLQELHAVTQHATERARRDLEAVDVASASVSASAVLGNLTTALRGIAAAWRSTGAGLAQVVAQATPRELDDPGYLHGALQLEQAVSEWQSYSEAVRGFIRRLLVGSAA